GVRSGVEREAVAGREVRRAGNLHIRVACRRGVGKGRLRAGRADAGDRRRLVRPAGIDENLVADGKTACRTNLHVRVAGRSGREECGRRSGRGADVRDLEALQVPSGAGAYPEGAAGDRAARTFHLDIGVPGTRRGGEAAEAAGPDLEHVGVVPATGTG